MNASCSRLDSSVANRLFGWTWQCVSINSEASAVVFDAAACIRHVIAHTSHKLNQTLCMRAAAPGQICSKPQLLTIVRPGRNRPHLPLCGKGCACTELASIPSPPWPSSGCKLKDSAGGACRAQHTQETSACTSCIGVVLWVSFAKCCLAAAPRRDAKGTSPSTRDASSARSIDDDPSAATGPTRV
eukprot:1490540-Prymnesium_polylepis.1